MEIVSLNKQQLIDHIESAEFKSEDFLPISVHRALSQIKNPRANQNDVLLLLAKKEGKLLGYLGVLPDLLFAPNQPIIKVGWLSCIWVSPAGRGMGISNQLISKAHFKYNGNILLTEYVPQIKRMYDSTGFFIKNQLVKKGIRLYLKSDFESILPAKFEFLKPVAASLRTFDSLNNSALNLYHKSLSFPIDHLTIEEVNEVDDEMEAIIIKLNGKDYFQRKKRELNWIVQEPWMLERDDNDELHQKYYFSASDITFKNKLFKLRDDKGNLKSFLFFTNRNRVIKLPYFFGEGNVEQEIMLIQHLLQKWNAKVFTCYQPKLVAAFTAQKTMAFHKKEVHRNYLVDKQLSKLITHANLFIQDGDGDTVFT